MPFMSSRDPLTGEVRPVNPSDVMVAAPMMAAGPVVKGAASVAGKIAPELAKAFQKEMYNRYIQKFFQTAPKAAKAVAKIASKKGYPSPDQVMRQNMMTQAEPWTDLTSQLQGAGSKMLGAFSLPAFLGGGPKDIELPNESGVRDPRLPAPGVLEQLRMAKQQLDRIAKGK